MSRTLSDEDLDALALRVVELIGARCSTPVKEPVQMPAIGRAEAKLPAPKLAYSLKELAAELGVSRVTLYRLEQRGLIRPLGYFRTKVFARAEVERFLREGGVHRPG